MNIISNRKKFFAVSVLVILIGIAAMVMNGSKGNGIFNFDVDFTGGTSMQFDFGKEINNDELADVITEVTGQRSPQIQKILGTTEIAVKMQSIDSEMRLKVMEEIKKAFDVTDDALLSSSDISATVSGEMQKAAVIAVLVSCIAMLIYISIRFKDVRFGASAIIALLHDVCIVIAFYAILRIPVNNSFIAALLTVLGYSINATIVIFDRVRENRHNYKRNQMAEMVDKSINQTLARSVNTSLTTLFTIGAIYILGVASVKEFALPIIIGIISGTYSSVFLAGSVWYMFLPKDQK